MVYILCWTYPFNDFIVVFVIMATSEVSWKEATVVCVCGECVLCVTSPYRSHDHTATKIGLVSGFCVGGQTCKKPFIL